MLSIEILKTKMVPENKERNLKKAARTVILSTAACVHFSFAIYKRNIIKTQKLYGNYFQQA